MLDLDDWLADYLATPDLALLSPAALRLGRRLLSVRRALDPLLVDPLDRALLGLGAPPVEEELGRAVLSAVAAVEGGGPAPGAAGLEERAQAEPRWWPLAAQVHAASSKVREQQGRMRLSVQELPYAFPGELDPVTVEVLAVGARVLPALHVDWARKLTDHAADALLLDCRAMGMWFWPVLRSMATERLVKPVSALTRARRVPPGGLGLAAAYVHRLGAPWAPLIEKGGDADRLMAALAIIGERPQG